MDGFYFKRLPPEVGLCVLHGRPGRAALGAVAVVGALPVPEIHVGVEVALQLVSRQSREPEWVASTCCSEPSGK